MDTISANNKGIKFANLNFLTLDANDKDFSNCEFLKCDFLDYDMAGAAFSECKFINCNFSIRASIIAALRVLILRDANSFL